MMLIRSYKLLYKSCLFFRSGFRKIPFAILAISGYFVAAI